MDKEMGERLMSEVSGTGESLTGILSNVRL